MVYRSKLGVPNRLHKITLDWKGFETYLDSRVPQLRERREGEREIESVLSPERAQNFGIGIGDLKQH